MMALERKSLLVKDGLERCRVGAALVVLGALAGTSASLALPHGAVTPAPGISVVQEGRSERWIVDLGGALVAAVAPEMSDGDEGLFLLVHPPRKPFGPRKLLHLVLVPEPRLDLLAEGIDGSLDSLAVVEVAGSESAGTAELVAGAPDRILSLGKLADLVRRSTPGEALPPLEISPRLEAAGLDLAAFEPGRLRRGVERRVAALEPGRLRLWRAGDTWTVERQAALPLAVTRTSQGLRLASPPVAAVRSAAAGLFLAGPEAVGSTRLRCYRIDPAAAELPPKELWAALPGPEKVSQSWAFEIDGVPVLIVRTQAADELNLFERQRLRVLPLSTDRTRAGSAPTLAVELDSKRWHETGIALGDVDGDGRADLVAAFPEGLSGSDLVAQWWHGEGGGRFASRPQRTDLKDALPGWQLVATPRPGLLLVGNDRLELRAFAATGRGALVDRAELAAPIPALPPAPGAEPPQAGKQVTVRVGSDGESSKVENVEPDAEPLGAVELDRLPGAELLALQATGNGNERLILLRARPE
jgi:hypothetical protein